MYFLDRMKMAYLTNRFNKLFDNQKDNSIYLLGKTIHFGNKIYRVDEFVFIDYTSDYNDGYIDILHGKNEIGSFRGIDFYERIKTSNNLINKAVSEFNILVSEMEKYEYNGN